MIFHIFYFLVSAAIGFGIGRIHNKSKFFAILESYEEKATQEVKSVLASIRARL